MRKEITDQCQAVIAIITGNCVWWENGTYGKQIECKLCKRKPDSIEHVLYVHKYLRMV